MNGKSSPNRITIENHFGYDWQILVEQILNKAIESELFLDDLRIIRIELIAFNFEETTPPQTQPKQQINLNSLQVCQQTECNLILMVSRSGTKYCTIEL